MGVKRPDFGSSGTSVEVHVNAFVTSIPEEIIRHYDVAITPSSLPSRLNMLLVKKLQAEVAPDVFTPSAVFDGRKNMFAARILPLGPTHAKTFDVTLAPPGSAGGRPPKVYKIKITKVADINPEVLHGFVAGQQSQDNHVLTAIMALNVVVRMEPSSKYPFNVRSFFTSRETRDIGGGIHLWRGYFQSVRPAIGRMIVNVDISTGMMYKPGPLIDLCLDFFGGPRNPNRLSPTQSFPDRERLRLQRFLSGVRIVTPHTGANGSHARVIKKLTSAGANALSFTMRGTGAVMTVSNYFAQHANITLRFPGVICVEVGSGAFVPLELCEVPPGQIMRKQVPPEKTKDVVEFATKRPPDRLASIRQGVEMLAYGQSEYVRHFGMNVETAAGPLSTRARILKPPTLQYGQGSKELKIIPRDGSWNMIDKKFYRPAEIQRWVVVIYANQSRFNNAAAQDMIAGLVQACSSVGMRVADTNPIVTWENGQGDIGTQLLNAGKACKGPNIIVVVLPEGGNDIYTAVKHFGDVTMGVATQCLKSNKCFRAKPQYWANVCLKMNVKLGGINLVPDPASGAVLTDPVNPTIVMGADVIHPAPGSEGRPSFTALVGNVDTNAAKYVATTCVQTSGQEIIDDLKEMCKDILGKYMQYRTNAEKQRSSAPKRLIFYRDGVSEGQFQQVLDLELPLLKEACDELQIAPKITLIIVGKRHHIRFFPKNPQQADRSGNCPAGTVIDCDITHPTEFDFYLQSHGGLLGTSRPAHYSVLYDENRFNADAMQALSFALCHVYARSTRSVSIPAPVYYADIVCSRAKNHYDPRGGLALSETATQDTSQAASTTLENFRRAYKPLHQNQTRLMYFS